MSTLSGFQPNNGIMGVWWIYRPDPILDSTAKEQLIAVERVQHIEATQAEILANISSVQISNNILTLTGNTVSHTTVGSCFLCSGFTNAAFLNRQIITVTSVTPTGVTGAFTHSDYGSTSEPNGAQTILTRSRKAWLYYAESGVSTSQQPYILEGIVASLFMYDMELTFTG